MSKQDILEHDLEEARLLDVMRKQARQLTDNGIKGLFSKQYDEKRPGWSNPGDYVEKAQLLKVMKQFEVKQREIHSDYIRLNDALYASVSDLNIVDLFKVGNFINEEEDHVPVLKACSVLETLSHYPQGILSKGALNCYYRILYELNITSNPDEISGGASAGADNVPKTAFVTYRCICAILCFRDAFKKTANALSELLALDAKPNAVPDEWWQVDILRAKLQAKTTLQSLKGNNLFFTEQDIDKKSGQIITGFSVYLTDALKKIDDVLSNIETNSSVHDPVAHKKANESINNLVQSLKNFSDAVEKNKDQPQIVSKIASSMLEGLTDGIGITLEPAKKFLSSIMDRELALITIDPQRGCDAAELIFAADGFGRLREKWDDKRFYFSLEKVLPLMNNDGRFPSHRPFDVYKKGYVLHVSGAEIIRAVSHLISHTDYTVDPDVLRKFLNFFSETWRDDVKGWRHERDHSKGECAWWLSALSIDTLSSVTQMIDQQINMLIFRHLSVRKPDKLSLDLRSLFYPDYGFVKAGIRKQSIAVEFQRLLAHVLDFKTDYERLYAIILFGPPDTGKTTLVEALAKSANVPFVAITPSDILLAGQEKVETRARFVFEALSLLTNAVILLDEFDSILWRREEIELPASIFQFLTPGMLPKLKNLYDSAEKQKLAYILSTNQVYGLDEAAVREGRFDKKIGVYSPDALSRLGRMRSELAKMEKILDEKEVKTRLNYVIVKSANCGMSRLSKKGWFTMDAKPAKDTPLNYILNDSEGETPQFPSPENKLPDQPVIICPNKQNKKNAKPCEIAIQEWQEWKWVLDLDCEVEKSGIDIISNYITSWVNEHQINGSIKWPDWKSQVSSKDNLAEGK